MPTPMPNMDDLDLLRARIANDFYAAIRTEGVANRLDAIARRLDQIAEQRAHPRPDTPAPGETIDGDLTGIEPNTVLQGLDIRGQVNSPGVILIDCLIYGGTRGAVVKNHPDTGGGIALIGCELAPPEPVPNQVGFRGWGYLIDCRIVNVEDGAVLFGQASRLLHVQISHLHQLRDGAHSDGIQIQGGSGHRIIDCAIQNSDTDNAGIMVTSDRSPTTDVLIAGCTLTGNNTPAAINLSRDVPESAVTAVGNTIQGYQHERI